MEYTGPRLRRHLGEDVFGLYSVTRTGRYLLVIVVETADPNRWVIHAAREMLPGEIAHYRKYAEEGTLP